MAVRPVHYPRREGSTRDDRASGLLTQALATWRRGGREDHESRNDEKPTHDEHGDADGPVEIFEALAVCGDVATER